MTAIGRPLRGAQLIAPITQQRVADGRSAAAARQRAAIRQAFQPLPGASGSGSIRTVHAPPWRSGAAHRSGTWVATPWSGWRLGLELY